MTANLTATDIAHLHHATELAKAAAQRGNRPFGAVIVDRDGKPLAEAENSVLTDDDIAAHAEMNAIRIACRAGLQRQLAGATMYASGEPHDMSIERARSNAEPTRSNHWSSGVARKLVESMMR